MKFFYLLGNGFVHKSPLECGFVYANNSEGQELKNWPTNCVEKGLTGVVCWNDEKITDQYLLHSSLAM